ncbi:hypothetical protein, partial [Kitasatospora sp. NPDC093558]|uniref:hypothetical protein n=1 Tax=Kitasatospora sp. NPDC093558 TaxID=3155201 RepID=UPI00342ABD46
RAPVPGLVVHGEHGRVFVGCADGWLEVLTTECDGQEVAPARTGQLPDGTLLAQPLTAAPALAVPVAVPVPVPVSAS